jgi:hypothetical protein
MTEEAFQRIWNIVSNCKFRFSSTVHTAICLRKHPEGRAYIQVDIMGHGRGSKHDVSEHMTESEIVYRCFKALTTYMEYELRDKFTYEGVKLFDPHTSVRALMEASQTTEERDDTDYN